MDQDLTIFLAPFAIVVGGALIATSGLTLFGYHYIYQNKTQAILGFLAGLVLLGGLELRFFASSASFFEAPGA